MVRLNLTKNPCLTMEKSQIPGAWILPAFNNFDIVCFRDSLLFERLMSCEKCWHEHD